MNTKTQITDEQLQKKLEESYIPFAKKLRLLPLIPAMSAKEKEQLIGLIEKADEIEAKKREHAINYQKNLAQLNEEYTRKMEKLAKNEAKLARKEFEKLAHTKEDKELGQLEDEMKNI